MLSNKLISKIKFKKSLIAMGVAILTIAIVFIYFTKNKSAAAAWWNESWAYRQSVLVTNNVAQETNVYISLDIDTASTTLFQADCGDLRFTKTNGEVLPYYIVSGCGTATTTVHVDYPIFEAGAQDLYYYYGNASASNGFSSNDFAMEASNYAIGAPNTREVKPASSVTVVFGGATTTGAAPILHLKMDEKTGTTANDSSGNGNNGTLTNGPTWTRGKVGGALGFDGVDDYVDAGSGHSAEGIEAITIGAWIKTDRLGSGGDMKIISKERNHATDESWSLSFWPQFNRVTFIVQNSSDIEAVANSPDNMIIDNNWHYIMGVYNGAYVQVYVDGVAQDSTPGALSGPIDDSSTNICVGMEGNFNSCSGGLGYFFDGQIDDVRIYNYARTQKQILEDMYNGNPLKGARVDLDFDEGNNATAHNKNNSSLNATLTPGAGGSNTSATQMWSLDGKFKGAVELDGADDYVSVPDFSY